MFKKINKRIATVFASFARHDLIPQAKYQHPKRLLNEAINRYGIDLIIDVGANHGQFALEMLGMGFKGRILSFEPTSKTFKHLMQVSASYPNWTCLNMALGDEAGKMSINLHGDDSLNSFLNVNALAKSRYQSLNQENEEVEIQRLDVVLNDLVMTNNLPENFRAFVKLDTQGYDLKVLSGMSAVAERVFIIQSEASVNAIYEGMPTYRETLGALDMLGFKPAAFGTVSRDKNTLQFVEFDIIALKS